MAKATREFRAYIQRKRARKKTRRIPKGVIHVQAGFNNTIVTVTDIEGRVISSSSAGICGFRSNRKGSPFAAETVARDAMRIVLMKRAQVRIKGAGLGREAALRAIHKRGLRLTSVRDVTPLPHNGCRPPKKRRV
uniref:Small ribosomal subunit protein uS11c n=3 Tax=Campanulaceae TaxID=4381 RepID=A0A8A6W2G5_9ASTR|nr:ribosomal protein S11 [Leptocodon hirsutus]YP_010127678.1 ribosomal protein S11 [Codonopsis tsinlingensis]YP_010248245.1 ribosomal protein S11 [Codonopsis pilosula]YP_010392002.1 ribosomal protein S11 [Codonopsis bhutanica]QUG10954.1 ribosomal protein S11 [Codonopsis pilosula subsp. tangshen]QKI32190.1 ribosomal protein S11 [Leptocodon hirsutus]QPP20032.1 ribosomal protein S11 [Codonopsis tsinlingensis]QTK21353.1 ribosomal protein S11 [Codonopsis pilosula]UPX07525.1 ribosomal protein S11